ncbi:hypothetical protein ACFL47_06800 [Candidatus Latescibacterota bacterium]
MKRSELRTVCICFLSAVTCALTLLIPGAVSAESFDVGIHFSVLSPKGDFHDAVDNNGLGLSVEGFYNPQAFPVKIGIQAGYSLYGITQRTEPFSQSIPDVRVDVETTNNIVTTHAVLRFQHHFGRLSPYLDGLFGFHYLFTETEVQDDDYDEPIASTTNFDDIALSYGIGAGASVLLYSFDDEDNPGKKLDMLFDFSFRYLFGGEAEYLTQGDLRVENGEVIYSATRSNTDRVMMNFGVVFRY